MAEGASVASGQRKVAVVTGAGGGIGRAIAVGLAKAGLDLTLVVRNPERGQATASEIQRAAPGAKVELLLVDLSSQRSIREGAATYLRGHDRLDVLVNCAGVFLPDRQETEDGIEKTFATNYLAYYLLTLELLPAMKRAAPSRIVNVTSRYGGTRLEFDDLMVKTRKYTYFRAVAPTMVARVLFTQELAERLQGTGVVVNALHPGLVKHTQLLGEVGGFFRWMTNTFGKSPEVGADTAVWLATAPEAASETGKMWFRRKPIKTPGQGSDPEARKRLWQESERLTQPKA
jgi:NAD(P)-dependent dehydrogenase (short-subunit alcohol dehydrogenase family)